MELRERLSNWFANVWNREMFEQSMGTTAFNISAIRSMHAFLAQALAERAMQDTRYLFQLIELHRKFVMMCEDLKKIEGHQSSGEFHFAMISGCLVETSLQAVAELTKEERDGKH